MTSKTTPEPPSSDMSTFQDALRSSKHIIAVAGAGLSAASGIPTFRGAGGMWRKYDATSLATPEAFKRDPSLVWQFYHYRREKALKAKPNAAHFALAQFCLGDVRENIAPGSTFTLITQNVDGLSQRAWDAVLSSKGLKAPAVTSKQPIFLEMHGRLFDVVCTSKTCGHRELNFSSPICPALAGTEDLIEAGSVEPDISLEDLPRCPKCHELARPGVVWFGEMPHHLDVIDKLVRKADMCLVVGTSSTVYPAASYQLRVKKNGGNVAVFNLECSDGDKYASWLFLGPCEDTLPKSLGMDVVTNPA